MSYGKFYLGNDAETLNTSPRFEQYTAVEVSTGANGTTYHAGNPNAGRTLSVTCQYANQEIANNMLNQINGYSYQPYEANGAIVDPAVEIGDGITTGGIYSGMFSQNISFGHLMTSDISAASDEELAHEFGYVDKDGKFATYASLANGTASINGAGLQSGTVTDGAIGDVDGDKLHSSSVGTGKVQFGSSLANADDAYNMCKGWARMGDIIVSRLSIGDDMCVWREVPLKAGGSVYALCHI